MTSISDSQMVLVLVIASITSFFAIRLGLELYR